MSKQNIHIAMGSLAYVVAKADGDIQEEEKKTITRLARKEFELSDVENEMIERMFRQLETDNISVEDAYKYAIDVLEANRYEFDFDSIMKQKCITFMKSVAESCNGLSVNEQLMLKRFKEDLKKF